MHLAPTASRRIYQQRVGRVTRRAPGKEAGLVIDFVHPATTHDETIVTLHSLLDRDVYRGGAIVVGPVRRGRGRKVRVERRIVPVSDVEEKRMEVLEREIWRIAVENLDYPEQHAWAALAGARVNTQGWRRARAMLQNDRTKELRRRFLLTCVQRNRNAQLRLKALGEIADLGDPDAFDDAIDIVGTWSREDKRAGTKTMLQALIDKRIGRRDQAQAWVWRLADYTRELHEEYAVQRWPETKRLLGLLVNSSGRAHGRNARRLVHAARKQDRRLAVALLAAAVSHTPEGEEVLRGARMRMARKPSRRRPRAAAELPQRRQAPPQAQTRQGRQRQRERRGVGGDRRGDSSNGGDPEGGPKRDAATPSQGQEAERATAARDAAPHDPHRTSPRRGEPAEDVKPKPVKAKAAKPKKAKAAKRNRESETGETAKPRKSETAAKAPKRKPPNPKPRRNPNENESQSERRKPPPAQKLVRWTSPAPRATRSPSASRTSRKPRSSTPSATPVPLSQLTSRPRARPAPATPRAPPPRRPRATRRAARSASPPPPPPSCSLWRRMWP